MSSNFPVIVCLSSLLLAIGFFMIAILLPADKVYSNIYTKSNVFSPNAIIKITIDEKIKEKPIETGKATTVIFDTEDYGEICYQYPQVSYNKNIEEFVDLNTLLDKKFYTSTMVYSEFLLNENFDLCGEKRVFLLTKELSDYMKLIKDLQTVFVVLGCLCVGILLCCCRFIAG